MEIHWGIPIINYEDYWLGMDTNICPVARDTTQF